MDNAAALLEAVRFDSRGLVSAVVQSADNGRVLMNAWMDAHALRATVDSGYAHYFSRSRQKLWLKGETSGHRQKVREIRLDCDGDAVLLLVEQTGGIACHTGRESCFYRVWQNGQWQTADAVLKDEKDIYGTRHT